LAQEIGAVWEVPSTDSGELGDETGSSFTGDATRLQIEMITPTVEENKHFSLLDRF